MKEETPEQAADRIAYKYLDRTVGSAKLKVDILSALRAERESCADMLEAGSDGVGGDWGAREASRAIRERPE